jgi:hypothetical protein
MIRPTKTRLLSKIRKWSGNAAVHILLYIFNWIPRRFVNRILHHLTRYKPGLGTALSLRYNGPPPEKLEKQEKFAILCENHNTSNQVHCFQASRYESIPLNKVFALSSGGSINVLMPKISLYRFSNASFSPNSDCIRLETGVFWPKFGLEQFLKAIPRDSDLIWLDRKNSCVALKSLENIKHVKCGFSLCGVHVKSWGHFIANFLPKLIALEQLPRKPISIIMPDGVDVHIQEVVKHIVNKHHDFEVIYANSETLVICDELYYCSNPSYLADHANYLHPCDIVLGDFSVQALHTLVNSFPSDDSRTQSKKLFIGRKGVRNLTNYADVECFFIERGFEVVYPHQLTFEEKLSLFKNATHVAGPYSSGFANCIFCSPNTKILVLSNFVRTMDLFLSPFQEAPFYLDCLFVAGLDDDQDVGIHNSFYIPIEKIRTAFETWLLPS